MISVFVALVVLGSLCDVFNVSRSIESTPATSMTIRLLTCFSVYSNGKKILATTKVEGSIDVIHGIRFFSMCWVVLGHTWFAFLQIPSDNIFDMGDVS